MKPSEHVKMPGKSVEIVFGQINVFGLWGNPFRSVLSIFSYFFATDFLAVGSPIL